MASRDSAQPPRPKLSRTSTPKVRSGCITCKRRHIKCDETKPSCLNCLEKNGHCEGYQARRPPKNIGRHERVWDLRQPAVRGPATLARPNPLQDYPSFVDDATKHYFEEFVCLVQHAWITTAANRELWEVILPQLSHRSVILRHAAVAIGAMSTWRQRALLPDQNQLPAMANSDRHYLQALSHYNYALQLQASKTSVQDAVILSFLLLTFESLCENRKAALDHVNHGLALLVALVADGEDGQQQQQWDALAPDPKPLVRAVADILLDLSIQGLAMLPGRLGDERPLPHFTKGLVTRHHTALSFTLLIGRLQPTSVDLEHPLPEIARFDEFDTYWTAFRHHLQVVYASLLGLVYASSKLLDSSDSCAHDAYWAQLAQNQQFTAPSERSSRMVKHLDDAFVPLFRKTIASADLGSPEFVRAIHLRLQCFGVYVFENPTRMIDLDTLAAQTSLFSEYLLLARMALRSIAAAEQGPSSSSLAYRLSIQNGLAFRLFFVAIFCRDPLVREDALCMMEDYPGHDGLFNTRSLHALALRNKLVEQNNTIEGTAEEQWRRLWRREYIFEECCDRIVFRYLEKNAATGEWNLVEELCTMTGQNDKRGHWERRAPTASGKHLLTLMVPPEFFQGQ